MNTRASEVKLDSRELLPVIILAGGLGTRLRGTYSKGPKSMAPVAGRPFLNFLLTWLRGEGVQEVILCVGYKRSQIQKYVGSGRKWGLRAKYSIEKELLGTGGALKKAQDLIPGDRMVVINGDTFLNISLKELVQIHESHKGLATIAVVTVPETGRYGSVRLDKSGRITAFVEKGEASRANRHRREINGGVYVLEKKLLRKIKPGRHVSLERQLFPRLICRHSIYGMLKKTYFIDIGVPDDLGRAQSELPQWIRGSDPR